MPDITGVVVTCEHGGHKIPRPYAQAFAGHDVLLTSHRGWDPGALVLARRFARTLDAPLIATTVSRLLVEVNRSLHHRQVFSPISRDFPRPIRDEIARRYYESHRTRVDEAMRRGLKRPGLVLHLGVHTFTPILDGDVRKADIGLLYEPRRPREVAICKRWQRAIRARDDALVVRRNYPYRGSSDGLSTDLRREFGPRYLGIELEVNQRFPLADPAEWRRLQRLLVASLESIL